MEPYTAEQELHCIRKPGQDGAHLDVPVVVRPSECQQLDEYGAQVRRCGLESELEFERKCSGSQRWRQQGQLVERELEGWMGLCQDD